MSLSDWYVKVLLALTMTIQLPFFISITYIFIPLLTIDFFHKKSKVPLDK